MFKLILLIVLLLSVFSSLLAYLLGPNLLFGIRIGFTMLDERVWKKTHKLLTVLLLISLALFYILSCFIDDFVTLLLIFSILLIVPFMVSIIKSIEYAEIITGFYESEGDIARKIPPLRSGIPLRLSILINVVFAIIIIISYFMLPENVAIRFDFQGNPIAWQEKMQYLVTISLVEVILFLSDILVRELGKRYPISFYAFTLRNLGIDALFRLLIYALIVSQMVMVLVASLILYYAITSIFPSFFVAIGIIILASLPFILIYARKSFRG